MLATPAVSYLRRPGNLFQWNVLGNQDGNLDYLEVILLHELGHVYNQLSGSGGSSIL
jgi:hypothetical protein